MHDRLRAPERERDLNDKERLLLDGWTANYPELGAAYRLKETSTASTKDQVARSRPLLPTRWRSKAVVPEVRDAYSDQIRAFTNWQPWIINYFEHPVTERIHGEPEQLDTRHEPPDRGCFDAQEPRSSSRKVPTRRCWPNRSSSVGAKPYRTWLWRKDWPGTVCRLKVEHGASRWKC